MSQGAWQRQELTRRASFFQRSVRYYPNCKNTCHPCRLIRHRPLPNRAAYVVGAARELLTLIRRHALLIALDDLQWSDGSSAIVGLSRPPRAEPPHSSSSVPVAITNLPQPSLRSLRPICNASTLYHGLPGTPQCRSRSNTLVSNVPHIPDPLVQRISDRAAGNPFSPKNSPVPSACSYLYTGRSFRDAAQLSKSVI